MEPPSRERASDASGWPPLPPSSACRDLLPPEVFASGSDSTTVDAVWTGVVWSRLARGDLAWAWWDRAIEGAAAQDAVGAGAVGAGAVGAGAVGAGARRADAARMLPRRVEPWIAAERGRCLRELGLHRAAEDLESPALAVAGDPVDRAMLRVSLVADAVGQVRVDLAHDRLDAARRAVGGLVDGPRAARQRLRLAWVTVEVALLTGRVPSPSGLPRWDDAVGGPALPPDHAHGSRFHTAKGLLFGAVVHDDARLLVAADDLAPPVLRWAVLLACADRGTDGAMDAARAAWRAVVPPPGWERQVAMAPTARRFAV